MSHAVQKNNAWILEPYCFCKDKPWLTVNDIIDVDDDNGNVAAGGGITPLSGLSREDTALLAALLTALAIFLFLLFLLLCLFCPLGICCGKRWACCFKRGKEKSKKTAMAASSPASGNNVSLTAVDMKIPRVWTDNEAGLSDSELERKGKHIDVRRWADADDGLSWGFDDKDGYNTSTLNNASLRNVLQNGGFKRVIQNGGFKDGNWRSAYDLGGIYGGGYRSLKGKKELDKGTTGSKMDMIAMDEFHNISGKRKNANDSASSLRYRSGSFSNIHENLMTPRTATNLSTHSRSGSYGNRMAFRDDSKYGSDSSWKGKLDHEKGDLSVTAKQENNLSTTSSTRDVSNGMMSSVRETTLNSSRGQTGTSTQSLSVPQHDNAHYSSEVPRYAESSTTMTSLQADNNGGYIRKTDAEGEPSDQNKIIMEMTSSYVRRVVEETETVMTS